jgi:8-oxo-dGTP diphosphatase
VSEVVGVAIQRGGRVLAARRVADGWEFPGGKVEPGESAEQAAVREIAEELGCVVELTGWLEPVIEIREGLVLRVATARLVAGEPVPRPGEHDAIRWLTNDELDQVEWLPADRPFVTVLRLL